MIQVYIYHGDKTKDGNYIFTGITDAGEVIIRLTLKNPENAKKIFFAETAQKIKLDSYLGKDNYDLVFISIPAYKNYLLMRQAIPALMNSPWYKGVEGLRQAFETNATEGKKEWLRTKGVPFDYEKDLIKQGQY